MKTKYRIVGDRYLGYECQIWRWYWPFWVQMGFTNTHSSIEDAKRYIDLYDFAANYKPNEK
jgi:hypothetical protein